MITFDCPYCTGLKGRCTWDGKKEPSVHRYVVCNGKTKHHFILTEREADALLI